MNDLTLYRKPKFSVRIFLDRVLPKKYPTVIDVVPIPNPKSIEWRMPIARYIQRLVRFLHDADIILGFLTFLSGCVGSVFSFMIRTMSRDSIPGIHLIGFGILDFVLYSVLMGLVIYVCWELHQVWKWLKKWATDYELHKKEDEYRKRRSSESGW